MSIFNLNIDITSKLEHDNEAFNKLYIIPIKQRNIMHIIQYN